MIIFCPQTRWEACKLFELALCKLEEAVSLYLLSISKSQNLLRINWIPKKIFQFCYLRFYLGIETVPCRLQKSQKNIMVSAPWWNLFKC